MAKRETLDDLLAERVPTEGVTEFAERAGVSPRTLFRLRSGIGTRPTRGVLTLLALALKVAVDQIGRAHV